MNDNQVWYIYIIACHRHTLYTGVTTDVQRRLFEHQSQGSKCAKYLRGKSPLTLVFSQLIGSKSEALTLERFIKRLPREKKEAIIQVGKINLKSIN